MLLILKILALLAVGYGVLYLAMPPGNFLYEGLRLPFWLLRVRSLAKPQPAPTKIRYGKHFRQYLLHFAPPENAPTKQHIVIYTHGSGWQFGRPEMFTANAQWLAAQGFHAFFLTHRRIPQYDIRQLREDARLGIKAAWDEMERLGIAQKKIILCGNSAGGHLAALALLDQSLLAASGLNPSMFAALACFSAPLDLRVMWSSPPLLMLTRMKTLALFKLANPIYYLETAQEIPILLVHGDKDGFVEVENSVVFYDKLRELGTRDLQIETLKNGTHLDAASWCFPDHPCSRIFREWLERVENQV